MTNNFNIGELARIAKAALDTQTKGQEFMLEDVLNVTRAAYEQYPEDPVIRQVAFTIERMMKNASSGATINQATISDIYNHYVRLGESNFRDVLGHLLLTKRASSDSRNDEYVRLNRVDAEQSGLKTDDFVNKNFTNALTAAFGGSIASVKAYDEGLAATGSKFVAAELRAIGVENPSVEIMGGDQNTLVYASHFETRKGRVTVAIPVEVSGERVLFPSTFVAGNQLKELTASNLKYFVSVKEESNDFSIPKAHDVLAAVGIISGKVKTASENESFNGELDGLFGEKAGDIAYSTPGLYLDRKYEEPKPDINTHQEVEMPQELAHLARDFENDLLEAASSFGMEAIRKGKELIARELKAAGFHNAQVKFGSEASDSVVYLAGINTPKGPVEIEVPVEMQTVAGDKYLPLMPTYFAYDGLIEDFTAPRLQRFAISLPTPSSLNTVYSSAFAYMTLPELKDEILKAASDGDYVTCESALGEIQDKFSEEDFKNAVADYHYILMQKSQINASEQHQCNKMIPAGKGSVYARCGHFGVPMHKIVVGADGNCRLKTAVEREKLNPTEDGGAAMSSAKIFMA